jgi:phosphate-selective porin
VFITGLVRVSIDVTRFWVAGAVLLAWAFPAVATAQPVHLDFTLKVQADTTGRGVDLPQRRIGVEGRIFTRVTFQIERELKRDNAWRDVFGNVRIGRALQVRAGHFKVPFGLERTTAATELDFVERTMASNQLAPGRAAGVMAHGRVGRGVEYEAGAFTDGVAVRVVTKPLAKVLGSRPAVGAALSVGHVPEGINEFDVSVKGRRIRSGLQGEWRPGRLGLRAEYLVVTEERQGQGLGDVDLSPIISRGWYASAMWDVTRDGVWQAGVRVEGLQMRSGSQEGPAFAHPRADHLVGSDAGAWTLGLNRRLSSWARVQANLTRRDSWHGVVRMQVSL